MNRRQIEWLAVTGVVLLILIGAATYRYYLELSLDRLDSSLHATKIKIGIGNDRDVAGAVGLRFFFDDRRMKEYHVAVESIKWEKSWIVTGPGDAEGVPGFKIHGELLFVDPTEEGRLRLPFDMSTALNGEVLELPGVPWPDTYGEELANKSAPHENYYDWRRGRKLLFEIAAKEYCGPRAVWVEGGKS
jgi:hypothetical protein